MITEEALPTYMAMLNTLDGAHALPQGLAVILALALAIAGSSAVVMLQACRAAAAPPRPALAHLQPLLASAGTLHDAHAARCACCGPASCRRAR